MSVEQRKTTKGGLNGRTQQRESNTMRSEGRGEDDGGKNDRDDYRDLLVTSLLIMACFFLLIVSARLGADIMYILDDGTSDTGIPAGSPQSSGRSPSCPPSWITVQRKCYFFTEEKKTQEESIKRCAERGSTLATVTERQETLQRFIRITGQEFWIGLINTKTKIPGKWEGRWADGIKVVINKKTDTDGSCALMGSDLSVGNCYNIHHWICERNITTEYPGEGRK